MDRIYLSPPHMGPGERQMLLEAFDSNWIAPLGPHVDAFERELAACVSVRHAVALSSGTAALHLVLHGLGVGRHDTVVTSTLTFAATANAITYVGAEPAFVDVDPHTWTLSPALLEEDLGIRAAQGRLPKAVIAVDLYGQCADYHSIEQVCDRYGVPLVEDAAEALGSTYRGRPAGSFGAAAAFSFNGNKIITTSGGGMIVSRNAGLVARARFLATQARDPAPHYQHSEIGFNYRLSNLLAALGRAQLRNLSHRIAARRSNRAFYQQRISEVPGIQLMPEAEYGNTNAWLTCITIDPEAFGATREDVRLFLESQNIESRPIWKPMHMQPVFRSCAMRGGDVSSALFENGLCLPSGSSLTREHLERIVAGMLSVPRRTKA